jgi:hypothetical protein
VADGVNTPVERGAGERESFAASDSGVPIGSVLDFRFGAGLVNVALPSVDQESFSSNVIG